MIAINVYVKFGYITNSENDLLFAIFFWLVDGSPQN